MPLYRVFGMLTANELTYLGISTMNIIYIPTQVLNKFEIFIGFFFFVCVGGRVGLSLLYITFEVRFLPGERFGFHVVVLVDGLLADQSVHLFGRQIQVSGLFGLYQLRQRRRRRRVNGHHLLHADAPLKQQQKKKNAHNSRTK